MKSQQRSWLFVIAAALLLTPAAMAQLTYDAPNQFFGAGDRGTFRVLSNSTGWTMYQAQSNTWTGGHVWQFDLTGMTNVQAIESAELKLHGRNYQTNATTFAVVPITFRDASGDYYDFRQLSGNTSMRSFNTGSSTIAFHTWMSSQAQQGLHVHANKNITTSTTTHTLPLDGSTVGAVNVGQGIPANGFLNEAAAMGYAAFGLTTTQTTRSSSVGYFYGFQDTSRTTKLEVSYYPKLNILSRTADDGIENFNYELVPEAEFGKPPYLWSYTPQENADWLSMADPRTGVISGVPGADVSGKTASLILTCTDENGAGVSESVSLQFKIKGIPAMPFVDDFESKSFSRYVVSGGDGQVNNSFIEMTAGNNPTAAASGALGLLMASNTLNGWPLDKDDPADQATCNDPTKWWPGAAANDPSSYHGVLTWVTRSVGTVDVDIDFDYQVVNQSTANNKEYYVNAIFEWSDDLGTTWNNLGGAGTNAFGLYRDTTNGFVHESESIQASGNQTYILFRLRWLINFEGTNGSLNTSFGIDNLEIRAPVNITTNVVPPAQETAPYERPGQRVELEALGGDSNFTWTFGNTATKVGVGNVNVALDSNASKMRITGSGFALEAFKDPADGKTYLRVPDFIGSEIFNGAMQAPAQGEYSVEVICTDGGGNSDSIMLDIDVLGPPPALSLTNSGNLPAAAEQVPYEFTLSPYGGVAPFIFRMLNASAPWVQFDNDTGTISGTPPAGANGQIVSVEVEIEDYAGTIASKIFTFPVVNTLVVAIDNLPVAKEGDTYLAQLFGAGGTPPYTWSILSGLPEGMRYDPLNGRVFGSPARGTSQVGAQTLVVQVTDDRGLVATEDVNLTVNPVTTSFMSITTFNDLEDLVEGDSIDVWFDAVGGFPPYTWSVAPGSLPVGLTMTEDGHLYGTVSAGTAREYAIDVSLRDSRTPNAQTKVRTYDLSVLPLVLPVRIDTPQDLPNGQVGDYFTYRLQASQGQEPYSWSIVNGDLPEGFSLDANIGLISGLPKVGSEGNYVFTIRVSDSNEPEGVVEQTVTLNIDEDLQSTGLEILTPGLPNARVAETYGMNLSVRGGNKPYQFRIISGIRPNGINFSPFGVLSGTPELGAQGNYPLTIEVEDAAGFKIQRTMDLKVLAAPIDNSNNQVGNADAELGTGTSCSLGSSSRGGLWLLALVAGLMIFSLRRAREGGHTPLS